MAATLVHVLRHGQVHNPDGILYGQLPGFGLSELGHQMAARLGDHFADVEVQHLRCSPLQRAQETMAPVAAKHPELDVETDDRLIEAYNVFEGKVFGKDNKALRDPKMFWHMRNPLRPSWGEPYAEIAARMIAAIRDAAEAAGPGGRAIAVSHQLPIYLARRAVEGRSFVHDPRRRGTTLASITTFTLDAGRIVAVDYEEILPDLLPKSSTKGKFRVGT